MQTFKTSAVAAAVMLTLAAPLAYSQTADVGALRSTVNELRKQVEELREQVKKQGGLSSEQQEGESDEAFNARTAASKADIQGLRTDIENYKYDQSRLQERNIPSVTRNTKIGGSLIVRYESQNPPAQASASSSGNGATEPRSAGFTAPTFGLNFTGNLYRDYAEGRNLTYRLALTSANTATSSTTSVNLTDAYIRYSFQPATGNLEDPLGTITLGQQLIPFGLDAQADQEVKPAINGARFVSGLGVGTRQVGLVISGDYEPYVDFTNNYRAPLISYGLGIVNGNGANKADNNDKPDYIARLVYTLPVDYTSWIRQLQIGSSYYRGYQPLGAQPAAPAPSVSNPYPTAPAIYAASRNGSFNRYGFDVNWTHLPFSISYEWAYGKEELLAATSANPDGYKRGVGQYINFGYTWGEQFLASSRNQGKFDDYWPKSYQAFVRFDSWDPNKSPNSVTDKKIDTTLGLNVFFAETTRFQINLTRTKNQVSPSAVSTDAAPRTSNLWQAQFNTSF